MTKIRTIVFPVFNWGQAFAVLILIFILILGAIFVDSVLALRMAVGAYVAIVIYMSLLGLAPDEVEIRENEIGPISAFLATQRLIHPIEDRVWAPARSRSRLFKSDWISIEEVEGNKFILKARKRDLKIILSEIRPKKADYGDSALN